MVASPNLVRPARAGDAVSVSEVVQAGFARHVAPDWDAAAGEEFLRETTPERLEPGLQSATFAAVCEAVCESELRVVGVIVMPRPTLVQLLFVRPEHIGTGIGRALWEAARADVERNHPEVRTVELNASPFALAAYQALGFYPISPPFRRRGAVATRMACWLPARALTAASS